MPACYLAEQHGANRRDFYFVTEDVAGLERIAAEALSFPLAIERRGLAEVAPIILPTEAIGELGLDVVADDRVRPTRFEFWGADTSLTKLRAELQRRGYRYVGLDPGVMELRMIKPVPIDGPGFLSVLKEIAPLGALARLQLSGHGDHRGLRPVRPQPAPAGPLRCRHRWRRLRLVLRQEAPVAG